MTPSRLMNSCTCIAPTSHLRVDVCRVDLAIAAKSSIGGEPRRRQLVLHTAVAPPVPGVRGTSIVILVDLATEDDVEGLRHPLSHRPLQLTRESERSPGGVGLRRREDARAENRRLLI